MEINLRPGHVIHTLIQEHEEILTFLDKLERVNLVLQKENNDIQKNKDFKMLEKIAEHLVGADPHHRREEEVLFPELEKRGVFGPPEMMREEHKALRAKKKELLELSQSFQKMDISWFKEKLNEAANFLVSTLKEHIFKENEILYPLALETIQEEGVWQKMKEECDKIGYCCFTPEVGNDSK